MKRDGGGGEGEKREVGKMKTGRVALPYINFVNTVFFFFFFLMCF